MTTKVGNSNETRKVRINIFGHQLDRRQLDIEVPVAWSNTDIARFTGKELDDIGSTETSDDEWQVADERFVVHDHFEIVGDAPPDAEADVKLADFPDLPLDQNGPFPQRHANSNENGIDANEQKSLTISLSMKQFERLLLQAIEKGLLGVEIVDEHPYGENGIPRTHFPTKLKVSHLTLDHSKVYVGAVDGEPEEHLDSASEVIQNDGDTARHFSELRTAIEGKETT